MDDAERQHVEWIMRRAEAMGFSPERVARAFEHQPPAAVEMQQTEQLERPSLLTRLVRRRARQNAPSSSRESR